jgi:hypothetical protein
VAARGHVLLPSALALLSASCILGPAPLVAKNLTDGDYCASPHVLTGADPAPDPPTYATPEAVARGYSARSLDTARAIGAAALVERLAHAQTSHAAEEEIIHLRGELNDAIIMATLDLSSAVAHIACEEGRAGQMASNLRDAEQAQTRNLTAWSLAVTSMAAIGGGVLALADKDAAPAAAVGISGGTIGGALGLGTLAVRRSAPFRHARNILEEVWAGKEHPDFPELVWAYLVWPQFTLRGDRTIREYLVDAWRESGRLGSDAAHPSDERVALFFGQGGTYDADDLDDRGDMLSEVREAVDLLNHELQHLATEAARH